MGKDQIDAARQIGRWVKQERKEHVKALEGLADGDTSAADARIAKLASSIPDARALRTRLLMQPDVAMRQQSFEMIYPHLTFTLANEELEAVECHLPVEDFFAMDEVQ